VDGVGKRALELLRNSLLKGLGDDRSIAAVLGVSLTASAGAGVVNLGMLVRIVSRSMCNANLVGEALLKTLRRLLLDGVGDL
jgi:hypothetical protein